MSAIPSERHLFGIIRELRRLNRSIALPLERALKRAGCPPLERYEVLHEIDESGDVRKIEDIEAEAIRFALSHYRGQMSQMARKLGIGRSTLYRKMKEIGIDADVLGEAAA